MLSRDIERTKTITKDLWSGMLNEMRNQEEVYNQNSKLYININNPLIQKITKINQENIFKKCTQLIYINSLMIGHFSLNEKESQLLNENLIDIIDLAI